MTKENYIIKKTAVFLMAAALAVPLASCSKDYEGVSSDISAAGEVTEAYEDDAGTDSSAESFEDTLDEWELPDYDSHAGINMKAEPMPETEPVPDDWHEVSNGVLSFKVPAGVEYKCDEVDLGGDKVYKSEKASSEDRKILIMFYDGNDWSTDADDRVEYDIEIEDEYAEEINREMKEKGYPEDDYFSDEKTVEYMSELGLEYDGTRESEYKALLEFDESMLTGDNKEAFEYIASLKANMLGMSYPAVYYKEIDEKSVFIHKYPGILYDPSKAEDKEYKSVWISAFASPDMEYTALVRGNTPEETLQIVSTMKIVGQ